MPKEIKKIEMSLLRDEKGCAVLELLLPHEFEEFYASLQKGETKQSKFWFLDKERRKPALFYTLTPEYKTNELRITKHYNDYGRGLLRNEAINLAPLRTINNSKKITIYSKRFDDISNFALSYYIKEFGVSAKSIYEQLIAKKQLKALITFEL